jgi:hypothetical protein
MWKCPISQHVLHVHCAIYLWIFPYLEEFWNFRYGTPPKKHKMEIVKVVRKYYKVSENEIHITLEDQNAIDNG